MIFSPPPLANRLIACWHLTEVQHLLCFPPCDRLKRPFSPFPNPGCAPLPCHTCRELDTAPNLLVPPTLPPDSCLPARPSKHTGSLFLCSVVLRAGAEAL